MTDREKVIERLGRVSYCFKTLLAVGWQGDADIYREHMESVNMALAMLKEQEPVEPKEIVNEHFPVGDFRRTNGWLCGKCGNSLEGDGNYCSYCGQAVKWE